MNVFTSKIGTEWEDPGGPRKTAKSWHRCSLHWLERDVICPTDKAAKGRKLAKGLLSRASPSKQLCCTGQWVAFKAPNLLELSLGCLKYLETANSFFGSSLPPSLPSLPFFFTPQIFCNSSSFTFSPFNSFPLRKGHCSLLRLQSERISKGRQTIVLAQQFFC